MKKVLLAVDNTKGSEQAAQALAGWAKAFQPDSILLLYVERLFGWSLVGEALESEQDLEEVSEALEGSEYQEKLDAAATRIISHYRDVLEQAGYKNIQSVIKKGHPAGDCGYRQGRRCRPHYHGLARQTPALFTIR